MERKIPDLVEKNYLWNVGQFRQQMTDRIVEDVKEKGTSWREMTTKELQKLLSKYRKRKDWVSVANIAFMIWENEWRTKISETKEVNKQTKADDKQDK